VSAQFVVLPCDVCSHPSADPYCSMNERWRTCAKYTNHLGAELTKARHLIEQLNIELTNLKARCEEEYTNGYQTGLDHAAWSGQIGD